MKILTDPRSGSYQGITSSRNRFGQYVRTRAIPVQPRSPKQTTNRAVFTSAASIWRSLGTPTQDAWNTYASGISRSDSLGSSYQPTGAELFVGSVVTAQNPAITDPPTISPNYVLQVTDITYTDPTPGPEALDVTILTSDPNNAVLIETSGPISSGVTASASVRRWISLPAVASNLAANLFAMSSTTIAILTKYKLVFPSPVPGNSIWFRFSELFNDGSTDAYIRNKQRQTFRLVIP